MLLPDGINADKTVIRINGIEILMYFYSNRRIISLYTRTTCTNTYVKLSGGFLLRLGTGGDGHQHVPKLT